MKLYTTIAELKAHDTYYEKKDWDRLKKELNIESENQPISIADTLPIVGIKNCVWALKTQRYKDICRFLADVAETTLPVYIQEYPSDRRFQRCISLVRRYAVGLTSKQELSDAVEYTADTEYTTKNSAAEYATRAIEYAAYATAYTYDAIDATDVVYATAHVVGKEKTWKQVEALFIKHFGE